MNEKKTGEGSRVLRRIWGWRVSTVPLSIVVILAYTLGVPMARVRAAEQMSVIPISVIPDLPELGTPGLQGIEPVEGSGQAGEFMPMTRNVQPRPPEAVVSDERREEIMAQARAEEGFFRRHGDGMRTMHREHQLQLDYDEEGILVTPYRPGARLNLTGGVAPPEWMVRMSTQALEFDGEATGFGQPGDLVAEGEKLACDLDEACQEWLINSSKGIEHGYTISDPASGIKDPSEMAVVILVESDLSMVLEGDGLLFQDKRGKTKMEYRGLKVFDAEGRELDSAMSLEPGSGGRLLNLEADLQDAVFPITVDPVISATVERIMAMGGVSGDEFGKSSDGCEDVVAIGAPGDGSGTVRVFHEDEGGQGQWNEVTSLAIPASESPADGDRFGESVAVFKVESSGQKYIAVGAPDHGANGSVFVFCRNEGGDDNWGFVQRLTVDELLSSELSQGDLEGEEMNRGAGFGHSLDADGRNLVGGAPFVLAGLVFFFVFTNGLFHFQQTIQTPPQFNPLGGNVFGIAVALAKGILLVGASGENQGRGGAYLFKLAVATGVFISLFRLFSDKAEINAAFGAVVAIAITGLILAIGVPRDDVNELGPTTINNAGSVLVYAFTVALGWAFLTAMFGSVEDGLFGSSMDFNDLNDLVVGEIGALARAGIVTGAAYLFLFDALLFAFGSPQRIVPDASHFLDNPTGLGASLVLIGTLLIIAGVLYNASQGVVFRFTLLATVLTYGLWQGLFWTDKQLLDYPERTGPNGDWDLDGLSNLLEFLMFLVPVIANPAFFVGWIANGNFHVTFRQGLAVAGALLILQYALGLSGWLASVSGPLAGKFIFQPSLAGINANEYLIVIPLIFAALLFVRLNGELLE